VHCLAAAGGGVFGRTARKAQAVKSQRWEPRLLLGDSARNLSYFPLLSHDAVHSPHLSRAVPCPAVHSPAALLRRPPTPIVTAEAAVFHASVTIGYKKHVNLIGFGRATCGNGRASRGREATLMSLSAFAQLSDKRLSPSHHSRCWAEVTLFSLDARCSNRGTKRRCACANGALCDPCGTSDRVKNSWLLALVKDFQCPSAPLWVADSITPVASPTVLPLRSFLVQPRRPHHPPKIPRLRQWRLDAASLYFAFPPHLPPAHGNHRSRGPTWVNASHDLASPLFVCRDYGCSSLHTHGNMGGIRHPLLFVPVCRHILGDPMRVSSHANGGAGSARATLLGLMALGKAIALGCALPPLSLEGVEGRL
jgi:hypothetical protein